MDHDIERIIVDREAIDARVRQMGGELVQRLNGRDPLVLAIMSGCVVFLADLLRALPIPLDLEFAYCTSYDGDRPGDRLEFSHRGSLADGVRGRHVLVVDDIFDTGRTLAYVVGEARNLGAAEVTTVVLLEKSVERDPGAVRPDLAGFQVENCFVVGYGLDYNGRYRNLPYIGVLKTPDEPGR